MRIVLILLINTAINNETQYPLDHRFAQKLNCRIRRSLHTPTPEITGHCGATGLASIYNRLVGAAPWWHLQQRQPHSIIKHHINFLQTAFAVNGRHV